MGGKWIEGGKKNEGEVRMEVNGEQVGLAIDTWTAQARQAGAQPAQVLAQCACTCVTYMQR
jgi:hypothetical protein